MNKDRLSNLLEFYTQDPHEPFLIYGIAMEYAKFNPVEADKYFSILLNDFPDYLPVYYQAALFYHERMDSDKALDLIKKGITVAQKQQQQKTLTELKNLEMTIMYDE